MAGRMQDVADKVGVSEATVSRVLNGRPGVAETTRQAVLTALDVLGYERPTQLRQRTAPLVGLVFPELQNPIYPALGEIIGNALVQRNCTPVLCTQSAGGVTETEYVELLLAQHVAGIIFAGGHHSEVGSDHTHLTRLYERGLPVVLMNASVDGLPFPVVACDDESAAHQAVRHVLALGHRRIGLCLGYPDHVPSRRKLDAARQVAAAAGVTIPDAQVTRLGYSIESGQAAASRLLRQGVTAIVCGGDVMALGAVRAVRRAGLRVPEDVSVVGYDDSMLMNCTDPALTTVRQPIERMGRAAVDLLLAMRTAELSAVHDELSFEPELIVRASTGPAPRA